jgi:hypothetical protein
MNGHDVPYQLRPNKFIDRQMFVDLLTRLIVPRGVEKYAYVSMGGRHLVDHYAVYNRLGIRAQLSFDMSANEVARQNFNRPTGSTICVEMNSADLPGQIDTIFDWFKSKENLIVWLDYTNTNRTAQFQEAVQTLIRLEHGDIFRITLNASNSTLLGPNDDWKADSATPGEYRAKRLREQIPDFLRTDVTTISETGLPEVLARCVELATQEAQRLKPNLRFTPALITSYRDGTRMLTVTCAVSEVDNSEPFPSPKFIRWEFACRSWQDIETISSPVLSTKEQYRLNAKLHQSAKKMLDALSFQPAENEAASLEAVESYKKFQRYYPTFRHVED